MNNEELYQFNRKAEILLTTHFERYVEYLVRFVKFICNAKTIWDYIEDCGFTNQYFAEVSQEIDEKPIGLPFRLGNSDEEEVRKIFAILMYLAYRDTNTLVNSLAGYKKSDYHIPNKLTAFNNEVIVIFIRHIQEYFRKMEIETNRLNNQVGGTSEQCTSAIDFSKIFIVHGHDDVLKLEVANFLASHKIDPVILSEKANTGMTIIEKIEEYSNVNLAVCLFTPDDLGRACNVANEHPRARQNVVLETGYFMAKLGRKRLIILSSDDTIELPSDLSGIVYIKPNNWKYDLLNELVAHGYKVTRT